MIRNLQRILLLLTLVAIVAPVSVAAQRPSDGCTAPSRRQVEDTLGEPVECPPNSADAVCFNGKGALVVARFNAQGFAESMSFSTFAGLEGIKSSVERVVPERSRGKFSKRIEKSERHACQQVYVEEYEWLSMEYGQENCVSLIPASIKVVWKECPNAGGAV